MDRARATAALEAISAGLSGYVNGDSGSQGRKTGPAGTPSKLRKDSYSRSAGRSPGKVAKLHHKEIDYFRNISRRRVSPGPSSRTATVASPDDCAYLPFDKQQLLLRIKSFKTQNWDINIDSRLINPLVVGLKGWFCSSSGKNEIICRNCGARIVMRLPANAAEQDEDEQDAEVESFSRVLNDKLVSNHYDNCPWVKQQTPLSVYIIDFNNITNEFNRFIDIYNYNLSKVEIISHFKFRDLHFDFGHLQFLLEKMGVQYNKNIALASLFGWRYQNLNSFDLLVSEYCTRRVRVEDGLDLLNELSSWNCCVEGHTVLLRIFKVLYDAETGTTTTTTTSDSEKETVADKLDKLRKILF